MFMDFDQVHHPQVMAGGCWMNNGFSTIERAKLRDWDVSLEGVAVRYKERTKNASVLPVCSASGKMAR
jgi:hypothetical protein